MSDAGVSSVSVGGLTPKSCRMRCFGQLPRRFGELGPRRGIGRDYVVSAHSMPAILVLVVVLVVFFQRISVFFTFAC